MMSKPVVKQHRVAILASTSLEDPTLISSLPALLPENLAAVSHIVTNGANELVTQFAALNGVPFSVYPLTGGGSLPGSTAQVLETADLVYLIHDECSKSAGLILEACKKKEAKYKVIRFDPVDYWKLKACRAKEILDAASKEDVTASPILTALKQVL
jgi:hypothetical protein